MIKPTIDLYPDEPKTPDLITIHKAYQSEGYKAHCDVGVDNIRATPCDLCGCTGSNICNHACLSTDGCELDPHTLVCGCCRSVAAWEKLVIRAGVQLIAAIIGQPYITGGTR